MNFIRMSVAVVLVGLASRVEAADEVGLASVVWPLERTAYFSGEQVPLAFRGVAARAAVKLEAVKGDGRTTLYDGPAGALLLDAGALAPGDYALAINGAPTKQRLTITSVLRKSAGSMQDEATPSAPKLDAKMSPDERADATERHWDSVAQIFRESGLSACVALGANDLERAPYLDVMARAGALLLVNPDTRPTSFFPVGNNPMEQDGMSQRMILTAQANGRFPNFGGFCFGWDTSGFPIGGRKGLMTYWGWGNKTEALRNYIARGDQFTLEEFTRRTGLAPVTESEYIAYLLAIRRTEFAPAIDLPTKRWLEEIAAHTKPLSDDARVLLEKRLDAWSAYLMGLYREAYSAFAANLRATDETLRNTASVQIDHQAVRQGQYFPSAYEPLDLQYQTTWNDQVGGPDYAYQWLLTAGLLDMHRAEKRTWLSNTMGPVHGKTEMPGKFTKLAAHGLAWGVSGIGFALEGFSNLLGGMNAKQTAWENIRGQAGEADVLAGREFLDRFAALAMEGRGDHGVGILFSKNQYQRQNIYHGYGTAPYKAFVALTRLGYTPRFVTEEDLAAGRATNLAAMVIIGQTFPMTASADVALGSFVAAGGRVLLDGGTTIAVSGSEKLGLTFPFSLPGKPHSWSSPNLVAGDNDTLVYERWHPELADAFTAALGPTGRGVFTAELGPRTKVSLTQIDGGPDANYVVAVNDSHVLNQADWHQVRERIVPTGKAAAGAVIYDCTEEQAMGPVAAFDCDLTASIARVYALLARPVAGLDLSANQKMKADEDLRISVRVQDRDGRTLRAVVPLHITVMRPDGGIAHTFYRSTTRDGVFTMGIPLGANAPAGNWSVLVRCQLDGATATLPVSIARGGTKSAATALTEQVIVRDRAAIEDSLVKGAKLVLPIFDSPQAAHLLPVAEKIRDVLARRGVEVEIRMRPEMGTHWLSYDPTDEQKLENARADAGELIGKIKVETVNGNDWYSSMSGYRFGRSLILLDLAGKTSPSEGSTNPMSRALASKGLLWPVANDVFPGEGRGIVQAVRWAFAPRTTVVSIQASDVVGLLAAAESLAKLPDDHLTPGIRSTRAELWRQYHVGGKPAQVATRGLTSKGLRIGSAPQPFSIRFGDARPLPADQITRPSRPTRPVVTPPATVLPPDYVLHYRDETGRYVETKTVAPLKIDLRFSEAVLLTLDVAQSGKLKIIADGLFRYSDRAPMWQAQWEDILQLHAQLVPVKRQPMQIELRAGDQIIGSLTATRVEEKEVQLELASASAGLKPKTAMEEVVTRLEGEIKLPAGRHELLLIHRHIVDGRLAAIGIGTEPLIPPAPEKAKP